MSIVDGKEELSATHLRASYNALQIYLQKRCFPNLVWEVFRDHRWRTKDMSGRVAPTNSNHWVVFGLYLSCITRLGACARL